MARPDECLSSMCGAYGSGPPAGALPEDVHLVAHDVNAMGSKGDKMSLKAEYALVTGGSRGIGRGITLKLAAEGVKVGVH